VGTTPSISTGKGRLVRWKPPTPAYAPLLIEAEQVAVQGKLVAVLAPGLGAAPSCNVGPERGHAQR